MTHLATITVKNSYYTFTFYGEKGEDKYISQLDKAEEWQEGRDRVLDKLPKVNPISCLMNSRFFFRTLMQMPDVLAMHIFEYDNEYVKIKIFQTTDEYRIKLSCYHVKKSDC